MLARQTSRARWTALAIAIALPAGLIAVSQRVATERPGPQRRLAAPDEQRPTADGMRFVGTVSSEGQTRAVFLLPGSRSPWAGLPGERVPGTNLTLQEIHGQKAILAPSED